MVKKQQCARTQTTHEEDPFALVGKLSHICSFVENKNKTFRKIRTNG